MSPLYVPRKRRSQASRGLSCPGEAPSVHAPVGENEPTVCFPCFASATGESFKPATAAQRMSHSSCQLKVRTGEADRSSLRFCSNRVRVFQNDQCPAQDALKMKRTYGRKR